MSTYDLHDCVAGDRPVDVPELRRRTCDLLREHVPLQLLLDLADPHGPDSAQRYTAEGGDADWLRVG